MFAAKLLFLSVLSSTTSALVLPGVGLGALAKLRGKYIGTATEEYNINNATDWGRKFGKIALSNEFSSFTNENQLKWEASEPQPGVFNFEPAEKLFALAKKSGKILRGHTLGGFRWRTRVWRANLDKSLALAAPDMGAVHQLHR